MEVDVTQDSGASAAANIHPKVESFRMIAVSERGPNPLGKVHHFRKRRGTTAGQISHVVEGNDHDVACGIGKAVEDNEVELAPE